MNRAAEISTTLSVVSPANVDVQQVTALTGIEPTKVWQQKNRTIASKHPELDYQEWQIHLPNLPAADFDYAINTVLDLIWHAKLDLMRFCDMTNSHITIHLMPHAGPEVIVYAIDKPETLERCATLKCRIHFHLDDI